MVDRAILPANDSICHYPTAVSLVESTHLSALFVYTTGAWTGSTQSGSGPLASNQLVGDYADEDDQAGDEECNSQSSEL